MTELLIANAKGNYFKDIFNWWNVTEIIAFLALAVHLIRRRHKRKSRYI